MDKVLAIIMAGGEGTRLSVLANRRAKPAVPFGGIYRIIDFTLSNVMHSGVRNLGIITQYRPYSLADHVGQGEWWGLLGFDRKCKVLSPHTGDKGAAFYVNTADAIYRNIEFIERFPATTEVLILSGDHIYRMDYRPMLEHHRQSGAKLTIATQEVPWEETSRFGIMVTDPAGRITRFQEKPRTDPLSNKASLGIYVFDLKCLLDALRADQAEPESTHDFGADIIPRLIHEVPVYNYDFNGYWRDVGTILSYMETSMEALNADQSGLDLRGWGLRTNHREIPLADQHPMAIRDGGRIRHSLVGKGSEIAGEVEDSILSPGVRVGRGARIRRSILLHGVHVGDNAVLEDVIMDKHGRVGDNTTVGDRQLGDQPNEFKPHLLDHGITVIGKGARLNPGLRVGRNCLVYPNVTVGPTAGPTIESGKTLFGND